MATAGRSGHETAHLTVDPDYLMKREFWKSAPGGALRERIVVRPRLWHRRAVGARLAAVLLLATGIAGAPATTAAQSWEPAPSVASSEANGDDALAALDRIIAAIERDFLSSDPGPERAAAAARPDCPETVQALGTVYVALLTDYQRAARTVADVAGALERSTAYGLDGQGCIDLITLQQRAGIHVLARLALERIFEQATLLADCAPALRIAAETELAETLNLNRRTLLQDRIDRARFIRGQSLRMAGEVAYLRDRRRRLSSEMAANLAVCGLPVSDPADGGENE